MIKYATEHIAAKNNIRTYQQLIKNTMTNHGAKSKYKEFKHITIDNETIAVKTGEVLIHHHEKIIFHICSFNHN